MLSDPSWKIIAEVTPPKFPNEDHMELQAWKYILVTDNPLGEIRVSPYAFSARITHDLPDLNPSVIVSSRDRNILAIESEIRGAIGNGVTSFAVVPGDTFPTVDHFANNYEIVEHLVELNQTLPVDIEIGMNVRFRKWQMDRRVKAGAQFLIAGPVFDNRTLVRLSEHLELSRPHPPVYVGVIPPFSVKWVHSMTARGVPMLDESFMGEFLSFGSDKAEAREWALFVSRQTARFAEALGYSGVILMGMSIHSLCNLDWIDDF